MVELFSERRRLDVLDRLTTFLQADHTIAAAVLVGSSAAEDMDRYSGLDLVIVVNNGAVFPSVYRKWKMRLHELFDVAYEFEADSGIASAEYSILLNDYLELNLYFTPFKSLVAEHHPWLVLYDATPGNNIEDKLTATYRTERIAGAARTYEQLISSIWQPIIKCFVALKRDEVWRALHMLERIRQHTIEVAALNHQIDIEHHAEVDQLPEMLLAQLRQTLPLGTDTVALQQALSASVDLFFSQAMLFESDLQFNMAENVYQTLKVYIEDQS